MFKILLLTIIFKMDVFYQAFRLDWDNNLRTIFYFRNQINSSDSIYLKKLENNLNVSYYLFPSNKLIDLEASISNITKESLGKKDLKRKDLEAFSNENEAIFKEYQIQHKNRKPNYLETVIEKTVEKTITFKFIDKEAQFQGKEIRGYLASIENHDGLYIFKEPKINDFDFNMKIKIQLTARDLAIEFSNFNRISLKINLSFFKH